ncbi:sensor domain-containing protein [Mycobacterium haemophilum]|uniref:sensor domain-containing protein n=1 Tax=Mycobacterium haemophilum TaxID=29311 RepID=UPI00069AD275|nr:sensor domain-containing protein [Mycobacterium haemophilum]
MALFISYSSQDRLTVDALTTALRRGQQQVWFDQELGGGDAWWSKILEQIRSCDVFIVALSSNWLQSKPSQAELRYAQALKRPILPVRIGAVDSMRVNPLATLQIIDYTNPTVDAGIQLVTAVHALRATPVPLPDPLPDEPPVPFGYITRLGNTLAEKELSPQQQIQLLVELKAGLAEDGDDPSARSDIGQLLRMLRLRHDVTYRTRNEIDQVLASIESAETADAKAQPQPAKTADEGPTQPGGRSQHVSGPVPSAPHAPAAGASGTASNKRLLIIGGTVLAAVVAIVVAVVFVTQGSSPKKPSTSASAHSAPAAPVAPGRLESILLPPNDVAAIMGVASMEIANQTQQLRAPAGTLSNLDCLGAFEPIQDPIYAGSGDKGVRGQQLHAADNTLRVYEAAVGFSNAEKAKAFVAKQAEQWKTCAGQAVTLTTEQGREFHWTFGDLTGTPPTITQVRMPGDPSRPSCQRVLSAVSDVVFDVEACAVNVADQGSQIVQKMAANVRQ